VSASTVQAPVSPGKLKKETPESAWFNAQKGKLVHVWFTDGLGAHGQEFPMRGRLVWVDIYSIGVQPGEKLFDPTQLIYKHAISRIESME
jgi:sRNA-binding regulator protein Hfq